MSVRLSAPLNLHWSRSKPNFGDALAPLIVAAIAGRSVRWAPIGRADLMAVGSLLGRLGEHWWQRRVHVWGSGYLEPSPVPADSRSTRHVIHAVRGPVSAAALGLLPAAIVQGDPGLLADRLMGDRALQDWLLAQGLINARPRPAQRCSVLVIPHYRDRDHPLLPALVGLRHVEIADVFTPPLDLLARIQAADWVLSSAMHGLIAADALGVPNTWVTLGDSLRGGQFKFRDYYGALRLAPDPQPLTVSLAADPGAAFAGRAQSVATRPSWAPATIDPIRHALVQAFPHAL